MEAVKVILEGDPTLTPRDLLGRTRRLREDQVVQVLVREAHELLDAPARQVMQALAVYPVPHITDRYHSLGFCGDASLRFSPSSRQAATCNACASSCW